MYSKKRAFRNALLGLSAAFVLVLSGEAEQASAAPCSPPGGPTGFEFADTSFVGGSISCGVSEGNDTSAGVKDLLDLTGSGLLQAVRWNESDAVSGELLNEDIVTSIDIGFSLSSNPLDASSQAGDPIAGLWEVAADFWQNYSQLILVQKGGNKAEPGAWVAFVIAEDVIKGTYESIFRNKNEGEDGTVKNISHITAYVVEGGSSTVGDVPLPAALQLLGGAMALFGIVGWRRRIRAG